MKGGELKTMRKELFVAIAASAALLTTAVGSVAAQTVTTTPAPTVTTTPAPTMDSDDGESGTVLGAPRTGFGSLSR